MIDLLANSLVPVFVGLSFGYVAGLTKYVVLLSAIPCGFFGILFGEGFDATPEVASSSLIASSVLGIFTLAGWIVSLDRLH